MRSFYLRYYHYLLFFFFFFNDTATTEIYTLSLHDALPILGLDVLVHVVKNIYETAPNDESREMYKIPALVEEMAKRGRSEEHTSELQSQSNLVCRLLLEKKKQHITLSQVVH